MTEVKNIILTGARGFIGSYLLDELLHLDYKIFAISRKKILSKNSEKIVWMTWENFYSEMPKNLSSFAIIHLATDYGKDSSSKEVFDANFNMPLKLFKFCLDKKINKIIAADTFFGKSKFKYTHMLDYIESKRLLVDSTRELIQGHNSFFINLRLEHIFGPSDNPNKFISKLLKSIKEGSENIDLTDGCQKRDFTYIHDAVSAFIAVLNHIPAEKYIECEVGTGISSSLKSFCLTLVKACKVEKRILNFGALSHRKDEIMNSSADISYLKSIGWRPKWDLLNAVRDLAEKEYG